MCYRLFLASPLTLSEVRSMLPEGITADLLAPALQRFFLNQLPRARTAVTLRHGGCACDLVGRRLADREEDERVLRTRYRRQSVNRSDVVRVLEEHRKAGPMVSLGGNVAEAFAGFVAEHARNAGPALFLLDFSADPGREPAWPGGTRQLPAAAVRRAPAAWLQEDDPVVVVP